MENTTQCTPDLSTLILDHSEHFRHLRRQPRLSKTRRDMAHRIHCHTAESSVHNRVWLDRSRQLADTVTVLTLSLITFLAAAPALIAFLTRYPEVYQGILDIVASPWIWAIVIAIAISLWWFLAMRTTNSIVLKIRRALQELWQGFAVIGRMNGRHAMASAYTCVVGMLLLPALCRILRIPVYH